MLTRALLTGLLLMVATATAAQTSNWNVVSDHEATELRFHSKATLESFEGWTRQLRGHVTLDPGDLSTLRAVVEADLASMDTGIGLRNKHMRNNVLHTDKFPTATFTVEECDADAITAGQTLETLVTGHMELHGVKQRMETAATVTLDAAGNLTIQAAFEIRLADYGIKRPKMLMMKVAEVVSIVVNARAEPGPSPTATPN